MKKQPAPATFREAVQLEEQARGEDLYTIPEIADAVEKHYPALVDEFTQANRRATVRRGVKAIIDPPRSQQPSLPGFEDIPVRISLPAEGGGFAYKATRAATRADFDAHLEILDAGIRADQHQRDRYVTAVEKLSALLDAHGVDRIADIPIDAADEATT